MTGKALDLGTVTVLDFPLAACANEPTELFFGAGGRPRAARVAAAKEFCDRCPHRAACLEHALAWPEPDGVWGGMTAAERRPLRRPRLETRRKDAPPS